MNSKNIQAPVALVTGAAKRIGAEIARFLHQTGFLVVIHHHQSMKEAQNLTAALNQEKKESALALSADLTQKKACENLIADAFAWKNRIDVLVNNASCFIRTDLNHASDDDWDKLFRTNVQAPFWLSLEAYPHLAENQGCIINITDTHADKPLKEYAVYVQSKATLAMQTKALACEFAPNVRVNAVAPGAIAWPEGENTLSESIKNKIIAQTPLKRHGEPRYIAQAVLALAQNPFITGETLRVDGGRTLI